VALTPSPSPIAMGEGSGGAGGVDRAAVQTNMGPAGSNVEAMGTNSEAAGTNSEAGVINATPAGTNSTAAGTTSDAMPTNSEAAGSNLDATGSNSDAMGTNLEAAGTNLETARTNLEAAGSSVTPDADRLEPTEQAEYQIVQPPSAKPQASILKDRTLTNLYNRRPDWLDQAHRRLDAAVFDAYGWPHDLSDDDILARLLALNLERAAGQGEVPAPVMRDAENNDEE